jgi:hypothetical protein
MCVWVGVSFLLHRLRLGCQFFLNFLSFDPNVIDDVVQTLEMLEKKEKMLLRNIATEIEKAWDFTRTKE